MQRRPLPLSDHEVRRLIERARATNAKRDRIEHDVGFGAPADGVTGTELNPRSPLAMLLRTAQTAIVAGLYLRDWDNVAEAAVMLEQATGGYLPVRKEGVA